MSTLASAATIGTLVVTCLLVLMFVAVAVEHSRRTRRQAADTARRRALAPLVHDLLDGEDAALDAAHPVLDELVLDLLPSLRGADRQTLQRLLVARGVVDRATTELTARAAWRRGRAAALLGSAASTEHTGALVALLGDPSTEVRCAAARALGKAGDAAAAGPLLAALSADPPLPPGVVGMAVLDLGTPALPALRHALDGVSRPARAVAAELLGLHGDVAATIPLAVAACDPRAPQSVRRAAAGSLGRIGSRRAAPALAHVLAADPAVEVQRTAAEALGRVGSPAGADALAAALGSPHLAVRTTAADALLALGPRGRSRLTELAGTPGTVGDTARAALASVSVGHRTPMAS